MVRKRSWPAVSHCLLSAPACLSLPHVGCTYDLQLDGLAIEFDSPDFLRSVSLAQAGAQHAAGARTKSTPMVEM